MYSESRLSAAGQDAVSNVKYWPPKGQAEPTTDIMNSSVLISLTGQNPMSTKISSPSSSSGIQPIANKAQLVTLTATARPTR